MEKGKDQTPAPEKHVVGSDPDRETRIAISKASGRKPYCIWDTVNADAWHSSSREVQDAWDAYVQREVDIWNEREGTYDRGAHLYHKWTPPLSFAQWMAQTYPAPELKHPEYAHGISDAELIKEAIEFCNEELDGYEGMEYDDDCEVACQRSNTFIRELVRRLEAAIPSPSPRERGSD